MTLNANRTSWGNFLLIHDDWADIMCGVVELTRLGSDRTNERIASEIAVFVVRISASSHGGVSQPSDASDMSTVVLRSLHCGKASCLEQRKLQPEKSKSMSKEVSCE